MMLSIVVPGSGSEAAHSNDSVVGSFSAVGMTEDPVRANCAVWVAEFDIGGTKGRARQVDSQVQVAGERIRQAPKVNAPCSRRHQFRSEADLDPPHGGHDRSLWRGGGHWPSDEGAFHDCPGGAGLASGTGRTCGPGNSDRSLWPLRPDRTSLAGAAPRRPSRPTTPAPAAVAPVGPVAPAGPADPPPDPAGPVAPAGPAGPGGPAGPVGPTAPGPGQDERHPNDGLARCRYTRQ